MTDGLGVVRVVTGADTSILYLAGDPTVVEASDYGGSLGWLAARVGPWPDAADPRRLRGWSTDSAWAALRGWLADPPERVDPAALEPLLGLLDDGRYLVNFTELSEVDIRSPKPDGHTWWYSDDSYREVIPVHHWPPPDDAAVSRQVDVIRAGARPVSVLLRATADSAGFLLDGHHKLAAYRRIGVPARFLELTRVDAPRMEPGELTAALPVTGSVRQAFGRVPWV